MLYLAPEKNVHLRHLNSSYQKPTQMQSSCLTGASILSVLSSQETVEIWYDNIPLKPDQFTRFMANISKHSNCSRRYITL